MSNVHQHTNETVCKLIIGNKSDLVSERVIDTEDGIAVAKILGIQHFECSAKCNLNIDQAILAISRDILKVMDERRKQELSIGSPSETIRFFPDYAARSSQPNPNRATVATSASAAASATTTQPENSDSCCTTLIV
jgi:GTPase SAR1 family protein